jgi:hypothetical protein
MRDNLYAAIHFASDAQRMGGQPILNLGAAWTTSNWDEPEPRGLHTESRDKESKPEARASGECKEEYCKVMQTEYIGNT